jgi:hypothetical protein
MFSDINSIQYTVFELLSGTIISSKKLHNIIFLIVRNSRLSDLTIFKL